ncbi:MAG: hypothetical protein RBS80_16115 [Thermoguttaceae bacterium]|jgi:hypothetical protein|nr:hypothetical protein [Thermoguttaceae bacterium]
MKPSVSILAPAIMGILACFGGQAFGSAILPGDLIGYWMLDGDLTDSAPAIKGLVGPGSDGTFTGGITPTFVTVGSREALDLRQATVGNNYVQTTTSYDGGPKTVVLWANSTHTGENVFWAGNERGSAGAQPNRVLV